MFEKILDYIRNFNFDVFIQKIKKINIRKEVTDKTKEMVEDAKEKEEKFIYKAKHYKLFEGFDISKYTSFISLKLIGILALIVLLLLSVVILVRFSGMYGDKKFEIFNEQIDLVQKKIIEIYDVEGERIGRTTTKLANKLKYRGIVKYAKGEFNKELTGDKYYLLGKQEKEKLGLSNLKNEYIVNYETSEVYSTKSIKNKGIKHYTSTKIENTLKGTATYNLPPIPKGFRHIEGTWDTGFVIKDKHGNEFVWVPVGYLNSNNASKALFRYYSGNDNKKSDTEEYKKILQSVEKYQGFYISRYEASLKEIKTEDNKIQKTNVLQVVKNVLPICQISYSTNKELINEKYKNERLFGYDEKGENSSGENAKGAYELAVDMSANYDWGKEGVNTSLLYVEQYDTLLKIIEKFNLLDSYKVDGANPITSNSSLWGNYMNSIITYKNGEEYITKQDKEAILLPTGTDTYNNDDKTITNNNKVFNIYDLAGNLSEWTNERVLSVYNVTRGGNYCVRGNNITASIYDRQHSHVSSNNVGIRVGLYLD